MEMTTQKKSSKIVFDLYKNETILTEQLSIKPLKIVNPKSQKQTGVCMLTSYGGGFVQGDIVELNVTCNKNTTSIVSSQANTRVYESNGVQCKQKLNLELKENAFHVFFNDPLVMHNGGNFIQQNHIHLAKNSTLLFIDWFSAGRTANGESFAFKAFETSTKIEVNKQIVLWDNFKITPENMDVYAPGMFGNHSSFLNLFLIGNKNLPKVKLLEDALIKFHKTINGDTIQNNLSRINDNGLVGRYSSDKITQLKKIMFHVSTILSNKSLLNYDHLERKY